eukprot:scaffold41985_cov49-Attheya_sp.AAC.5
MQDEDDSRKKRNAPEGHMEEKSPTKKARPDEVHHKQQQPAKVRHFPSCGGLHPNLATPTGDVSACNGSFPNDEHQYQYGVPTSTTAVNNEQEAPEKLNGTRTTSTQSAISSTTTILDKKMPSLPSTSSAPKESDEKDGDDSKMSGDTIVSPTTPTRSHGSISSTFLKLCGKPPEDINSSEDAQPNPDWVIPPTDTKTIDAHFRKLAFAAVIVWVSLLLLTRIIVPNERMERLEGLEQSAALMAFILHFVSILAKLSPFIFYTTPASTRKQSLNGVLMCALVLQSIAMTTDFYMATGLPTPVIYDP